MRVFLFEYEFGKTNYIIAKNIMEALEATEVLEGTEFEEKRIKRITDLGFCTIVEE